jgi:hypothetical protein
MKNLLKFMAVAVVIFVLNSCANKNNTPEAIAEKFLNHIFKKEYAQAKKYATEQTQNLLKLLEEPSNQAPKEVKITDIKCTPTDDKATCSYKRDGIEEKVELVKQDGKWLVEEWSIENDLNDRAMDEEMPDDTLTSKSE